MAEGPLIVTAQLPKDLHRWATRLREAHFPPERNHLEAHVTLFHALPGQCEDEAKRLLARIAAECAPVEARLEGVMSLGSGTALKLSSPRMLDVRDEIAERFHGMLSLQDQPPPRLHITIQNKVPAREAKALQASLAATIEPRAFRFHGLALFRYMGGPWDPIAGYAFRGAARR